MRSLDQSRLDETEKTAEELNYEHSNCGKKWKSGKRVFRSLAFATPEPVGSQEFCGGLQQHD